MEATASILIVEDNEECAQLLMLLLEYFGYTSARVSSASHALSWLNKAIPQLLIVDVGLPGMDGIELIQHLRIAKETASIPAVVYSSYDDNETKKRAAEAGAADFWSKAHTHTEVIQRRLVELIGRGTHSVSIAESELIAHSQSAEITRSSSRDRNSVPSLTPRQKETLRLLLRGYSEKECANKLGLSRNTLHDYVKVIYRLTGVTSRPELMAKLLTPETQSESTDEMNQPLHEADHFIQNDDKQG